MSVEIRQGTIDHPENPLQIEIYPTRGTYSIYWPTNKSYKCLFSFIDEMDVDHKSDIVIRPIDGSETSLSVFTLEELQSREFDFPIDLLRLHTVDYNLVWENEKELNSFGLISDSIEIEIIENAFRVTTASELSRKHIEEIKEILEGIID